MKIEQLTCSIGAELKSIQVTEAISNDDLFGEIKQALLKHKVLFLRDQNLDDRQHAAFARRFGDLSPLATLQGDARAKRALWPRLRAMRRGMA